MRNSTSTFKNKYRIFPSGTKNSDVSRSFYASRQFWRTNGEERYKHERERDGQAQTTRQLPRGSQKGGEGDFLQYRRTTQVNSPKDVKSAQKLINGRSTKSTEADHLQAFPSDPDPSISDLKWRPASGSSLVLQSPQTFVSSIPKNSLFFCCNCYQYVFEVQKHRHFPKCRDQLPFLTLTKEAVTRIAWQRLQRIVQLSKYTNTRANEAQDLWLQVKTCDFSRIFLINYPQEVRYFKLDQIIQAFVYTYERLLKGKLHRSSKNDFLFCY